jgi:eukaryotic-like serine/threonine-protein kinase
MTPEHWQRLQAVLADVLELPPAQQDAALAAACGDDTTLLAEARSLLAHRDALPEHLPGAAFAGLAEAADDSWRGRRVGAFVLEELLGSGGSSSVYRARRADDFAQVVAIKLLRGHDRASLRRFERERTILAGLHHAHIARLFDAGSTTDGTPYLVLEYVEGRTWDRWLAEEKPDLRRRIGQFLLLCDAVDHAHRRLLVHRDLKPANILVDANEVPRLLDFGIAALLDAGDSTLTREGGAALTPAYAAPEQLRGETVTTATDVYALGLVLYETLSGRHPFRKPGDSTRDVLHAITTREAPRPSQMAERETGLRAAEVRGDLDNIVLTAIEREPAQRYGTVRELADDLRAWLERRPVSARPHTLAYLARKFVARHRVAVTVAAAGALALLAASGVALWQARVALHERELAQQRLADVRRFANNLLFDYHEGIQKLAGSLPLQQRLVRDGLDYLERLRDGAAGDAQLWREIAAGYMKVGDLQGNPFVANLGDFAGAARSYGQAEAALAQATALGAGADKETRLWQVRLLTRRGHLHYQASEYELARLGYAEAVALMEALYAQQSQDEEVLIELADALDSLGDLIGPLGQSPTPDAQAARKLHLRAAELRAGALARKPDDPRLRFAQYHSQVREGAHWIGLNDMPRAEAAYIQALAQIESLVATDKDDTYRQREVGVVLTRLVQIQDALGKLDASVDTALRALRHMEAMLAADPGNDAMRQGVTSTTGWAARQLIKAGRQDEALPIIRRQIAVNEERLQASPGNPDVLFGLSLGYRRLGEQRAAVRDYAGALQAHGKALEIQQPLANLSPEYAFAVALSQLHIGRTELAAGRSAAARTTLAGAVQQIEAVLAAQPDGDATLREDLAEACAALGDAWSAHPADPAQARAAYAKALEVWDSAERAGSLTPKAAARRKEVQAQPNARAAPARAP